MKIILTDDRGVWLDGKECRLGHEAAVSDDTGEALIKAGLADKVEATLSDRNKKSRISKTKDV
tara:strand:- start:59 stop:247 length:189 start_codon:yes stop_codon:yes gene_type:complete